MKTGPVSEKGIPSSLFWGSVWGLTEASIGHLLHLLRVPGLAGFVMLPVGIFTIFRAFRNSGKPGAVFLTPIVAAGWKLIDFLVPGTDPAAVLRPALAILCEGLALAAFFSLADTKKHFFIRAAGAVFRKDTRKEGVSSRELGENVGRCRMRVEKTKTASRN